MILPRKGFEQFYEVVGQGIPLLCLPAFPFTHEMYREQRVLADQAQLILPDYRGTGHSSFTDGPYTMDLLADDMLELLDALQIDKTVILGVSMGMYVAFALYARHPERVRGLIMAGTRADADNAAAAERRQQTVTGLHHQGTSVLRDRVLTLLSSVTREQRPDFVKELLALVAHENAAGLAEITRGLAMRADQHHLLPKITAPALVLCGEEDSVSSPAEMRDIAEKLPNATFHIIPQAGHLSPWERPDLFNAHVREFLGAYD